MVVTWCVDRCYVLKLGREVWDATHKLVEELAFLVGVRHRGIPRKIFLALLCLVYLYFARQWKYKQIKNCQSLYLKNIKAPLGFFFMDFWQVLGGWHSWNPSFIKGLGLGGGWLWAFEIFPKGGGSDVSPPKKVRVGKIVGLF